MAILRQEKICLPMHNTPVWGFDPWIRKSPWRRKLKHTPVFLPGKSNGQRSLAGYSPWGWKELDMTERLNNNNKVTLASNRFAQGVEQKKTLLCFNCTTKTPWETIWSRIKVLIPPYKLNSMIYLTRFPREEKFACIFPSMPTTPQALLG